LDLGLAAAATARAQTPAVPPPATPFSADFTVDPRRIAFLNIDMQCWFVEGYPVSAPGGRALLDRLNAFAAVCRSAGVAVVHAAHILRPDGSNMGVMREYLEPIREGMIFRGSEPSAFHPDLVIEPSDIVLEKPRFGAFQGTDLELILRGKGIDSVIVGGIATNICCETTAREAAVRDFKMFFLSDGTAASDIWGVPVEVMQQATCASLTLFGQVLTIDAMTAKIVAA
jgi:ureidoacrylate peracid hydrolase